MTSSTTPDSTRMVTAIFNDRDSAERAYRSVGKLGSDISDVTLVMSDATRHRYFPDEGQDDTELGTRANEGAGKSAEGSMLGGPIGGTIGTLAPIAAAVGTILLIPGIIFLTPVAIALAAAGTVAVVGGVLGALANWGVPAERAEEYEADIRKGAILMGVKTHKDADTTYLEQQWRESGGRLIHS
jgi:hypothetical protein